MGTGRPLWAVKMVLICHPSASRLGPTKLWDLVGERRGETVAGIKVRRAVLGGRLLESWGSATVEKLKSMPSEASSSDLEKV